jgi:ribose transport system permease protein
MATPLARLRDGGSGSAALREAAIPLFLLALVAVFALSTDTFFSLRNLLQIANSAAVVGLLALGMTFVLILGGIDLSVGAVATLTTVIVGLALRNAELPFAVAVVLGLLTGTLVGLVNGAIVVLARVPAIIVTLGTMTIVDSVALWITDGAITSLRRFAALNFVGQGYVGPVPVPVIILVVLAAACWALLAFTAIGRRIKAIGHNRAAAYLMGLDVAAYTIGVYALCGLLAGAGGIVIAGQLSSSSADAGEGRELAAITAAVLGGTSLLGGHGTIIGTLAGALILSVLLNGLIQLGVHFFWQLLATGLVLIAAVAFHEALRRRE